MSPPPTVDACCTGPLSPAARRASLKVCINDSDKKPPAFMIPMPFLLSSAPAVPGRSALCADAFLLADVVEQAPAACTDQLVHVVKAACVVGIGDVPLANTGS